MLKIRPRIGEDSYFLSAIGLILLILLLSSKASAEISLFPTNGKRLVLTLINSKIPLTNSEFASFTVKKDHALICYSIKKSKMPSSGPSSSRNSVNLWCARLQNPIHSRNALDLAGNFAVIENWSEDNETNSDWRLPLLKQDLNELKDRLVEADIPNFWSNNNSNKSKKQIAHLKNNSATFLIWQLANSLLDLKIIDLSSLYIDRLEALAPDAYETFWIKARYSMYLAPQLALGVLYNIPSQYILEGNEDKILQEERQEIKNGIRMVATTPYSYERIKLYTNCTEESLTIATSTLLDNDYLDLAPKSLRILNKIAPKSHHAYWLGIHYKVLTDELGIETLLENIPQKFKNSAQLFREKYALEIVRSNFNEAVKLLSSPQASEVRSKCKSLEYLFQRFRKRGERQNEINLYLELAKSNSKCRSTWEKALINPSKSDTSSMQETLKLVKNALQYSPDSLNLLFDSYKLERKLGQYQEALLSLEKLLHNHRDAAPIQLYSETIMEGKLLNWAKLHVRQKQKEYPDELLYKHAGMILDYYDGNFETCEKESSLFEPLPAKYGNLDHFAQIYGAICRYQLGDIKGAKAWLNKQLQFSKTCKSHPDYHYLSAMIDYKEDRNSSIQNLEHFLKPPCQKTSYSNLAKRKQVENILARLKNGEEIEEWVPVRIAEERKFKTILAGSCCSAAFIVALFALFMFLRLRKKKAAEF